MSRTETKVGSKRQSHRKQVRRRVEAARRAQAGTAGVSGRGPDAPGRGYGQEAGELLLLGQFARAARLANELMKSDPDDAEAQEVYVEALEAIAERQGGPAGDGSCAHRGGGHSGRPSAPEARLLAGFDDRSVLYRLDRAILAWLGGSLLDIVIEERVAGWLDRATLEPDGNECDSATEPSRWADPAATRMALEHALLTGEDGDEEDSVLALFAGDPGVARRLAAAARSWLDHAHYGLWQVTDPRPRPGVWLTDLVSATRRYVQLSPDQAEALLPWSVLAGSLVPIEGVWRTTGGFARLTPDEGDVFCAAAGVLGQSLGLLPKGRRSPLSPSGPESRFGVLAGQRDPLAPATARALSTVLGRTLPEMLATLAWARRQPVRLTNTDGEPLCLITATLGVADVDDAWARLGLHRDIEEDGDEELCWWGNDVGPAEAAAMRANIESEVIGIDTAALDAHTPRWLRGRIRRNGARLVVEVNSQARLDTFLDMLHTLDVHPAVLEQTRVEPDLDLPFPKGRPIPHPMEAGMRRGWAASWVDQAEPAMGGLTPREAAADDLHWIDLEALLRTFEHDAALTGEGDDWVDRIRRELDLGAVASATAVGDAVDRRRARGPDRRVGKMPHAPVW
ncbi:MAG: hypothetical protein ACYCV7_09700 [Acidimicrobiales bacterium]